MNRVSWYIFRQLTVGMILVSVGLAGIIWLSQAVGRLDAIVNKASSAVTFIYLTMLLIPNFLTIVLPIAIFTVVLFIYSKLTADREIIVLRAAGVSPYNIAKPALLLGVIVTAIGYSLTTYLTPKSYEQFRELQWDIRYSIANVVLKEGVFNTFSDKITVYFRERTGDNELHGIFVHETRPNDEPVIYIADRGALVETPKGPRVVMFEVTSAVHDKNDGSKT
ncbi:MAG: LptF/LptG family permease, partial [Proteobacteria bacterium]|nr:LptF/LptG family permease [Pseudomonadota bacterium]